MVPDEGWPLLKEGSLVARAEGFLTRYILSGEVQPGNYLPAEHVLCERLGIGRSTLRETMSVLESKGLLERKHGVGVRVIDGSQQAASEILQLMMTRHKTPLAQLLEVRRLYEVQAAAWAAERSVPRDVVRIGRAIERMRAAARSLAAYADADFDFHMAVVTATQNHVLALLLGAIRELLRDAISESLQADFRPERTLAYHEQILTAITHREPEEASRAMTEHLLDTEAMVRRVVEGPEQG